MNVSLSHIVRNMSEHLLKGTGAYFLGSGISAASGLPDWKGLLEELAIPLGLEINENDDLTRIAQYFQNADNGNRGPLIGRLRESMIPKAEKINSYHESIKRTNLSVIWTTNYDTILEKTLSDTLLATRACDDDLVNMPSRHGIELIKIHGCAERSKPVDLIITEEDYENFVIQKPALARRLGHDLLHKSLLFIGYSYRDPNISTIVVEARRLAGNSTREHYFIAERENTEPKRIRQELWHNDLRRFGFRTAFIDDFQELSEALAQISLRSRGNSVFVTGSHRNSDQEVEQLGKLLVDIEDIILLDGQSEGVGRTAANAFGSECVRQKKDIRQHVRYFPNPYAFNPGFSDNPSLLGTLKKWRASLFKAAQFVVVYDGGMGTQAEVEIALEMGCRIIPALGSDHPFGKWLIENQRIKEQLTPDFIDCLGKGKPTPQQILNFIKECLGHES